MRVALSAVSAGVKFSAESVFSTLFPADCRICNEPLLNFSRLPVCDTCKCKIKLFQSVQCHVCGELLLGPTFASGSVHSTLVREPEAVLCGLCQRARPSYVRAFARGPYEGVLRDLIHLLKYERIHRAAAALGRELAVPLAPAMREAGSDALIIPVPLHSSKMAKRGFNQAEKIAQAALRFMASPIELNCKLLFRRRATASQTGLTRAQRRKNIRGAFAVDGQKFHAVAGGNIILVDDVFTTGITAEECARVLLRAGANAVWVTTVARVSKLEAISGFASMEIHEA